MSRAARSLRHVATLVLVLVAALAVTVGASLIILPTSLHRTTEFLGAAIEEVRLTEEAEIALLVHARSTDAMARTSLERELRRRVAAAGGEITSDEEQRAFDEARAAVAAYLTGGPVDAAFGALDRLADLNVEQARQARMRASDMEIAGDVIGAAGCIAILVVLVIVAWWLRSRVFRPLFALADTMSRYAKGDHEVKANEAGPLELREMAGRFNEMAEALAHQRQAQMAFLAGVAHDLRNPLNALRLSVSAVRSDVPPEGRLRRTFELVDRQVTRLDRMVSDFLDVARIEAGELNLQLGRADAREIITGVAELFESVSPKHQLEVTLPSHEVPILCDSLRIEQVLGNLLSNAIKYSPEGGDVRLALSRSGGWATISVTDHGLGIDEHEIPHLFEPFRRNASAAQTAAIPGAGLGLFVARRIIDAHAGRIEVDSTRGRGSTFRVRLPVLRSAGLSTSQSAPQPTEDPQRRS